MFCSHFTDETEQGEEASCHRPRRNRKQSLPQAFTLSCVIVRLSTPPPPNQISFSFQKTGCFPRQISPSQLDLPLIQIHLLPSPHQRTQPHTSSSVQAHLECICLHAQLTCILTLFPCTWRTWLLGRGMNLSPPVVFTSVPVFVPPVRLRSSPGQQLYLLYITGTTFLSTS